MNYETNDTSTVNYEFMFIENILCTNLFAYYLLVFILIGSFLTHETMTCHPLLPIPALKIKRYISVNFS